MRTDIVFPPEVLQEAERIFRNARDELCGGRTCGDEYSTLDLLADNMPFSLDALRDIIDQAELPYRF